MNRREAILASLAALPTGALAQPAGGRVWRIGWLGLVDSAREPYARAFVQRLQELGYVEGQNLALDFRHADGQLDRLPQRVAELAQRRPDIYFTGAAEPAVKALKATPGDTPIVIVAADFDPVATGHIVNLARPGGRLTGVTPLQSVLPAKRLELLREMVPHLRKVAVFSSAVSAGQLAVVDEAARRMGVGLQVIDFVREPFNYEAAFADIQRGKSDALLVLGSALFVPARRRIPELAARAGLPTMFHQAQWADAGGLASYGFSFVDMYRRAADQVVAVLRGAQVGDIPMEQGSRFELVINLRTAKALRLTIPQTILLRADRVIE
ncbi:MAG: ABC transporter substrate-binding protein [Rhodoferax sp.]